MSVEVRLPDGGEGPERPPPVVVLSRLFPHSGQPGAGLFIRERMFRVARHLPLVVVAPVPWFPGQGLIRRFRPHFRPSAPRFEVQEGIPVYCPRFFSLPGAAKRLDSSFMALACLRLLRRLRRQGAAGIIDAHFGYPDGHAAALLGRWTGLPFTVTFRGTEPRQARTPGLRARLQRTVDGAARVFTVADSLNRLARELASDPAKVQTIPNGVDTRRFRPFPRTGSRRALGLPENGPVLITVGTLVERKGVHRVLAVLPDLRTRFPNLQYLVVGGPGPEGDASVFLRQRARELGIGGAVRFLGPVPPERLSLPLSSADVFVLATRNEGWANVFLEAMACGLPVVTTDVGGNREVVTGDHLGQVVPFGDQTALGKALGQVLEADWDRTAIRRHAEKNGWEGRVAALVCALREVDESEGAGGPLPGKAGGWRIIPRGTRG